jgi:glycosyltransferase involved in cell wall biosynthesis
MIRRALPRGRIVVQMHQDELAHLAYRTVRRRLAHLDGVVTVSDHVTERARARFPEFASRIHTIGNGVDVDRFRPHPCRDFANNAQRLLFVGRISPEKGVHVLMEAFDRLARERKGLRLDLVGKVGMLPFELLAVLLNDDEVLPGLREFYGRTTLEWVAKEVLGQRRSYRDALLARLSPESAARARFLGTISLPELIRLYQDVDLLVLPSIWHESYGLPVAEAMASGVPVVASRCGGLPELVDHGVTGWLVPRADVDSLVTTLGDLLDDPRKLSAMGRAARIRAENHLTWRQSAERLERVYLDLVAALESDVMHAADGSSRSRPRAKPLGAGAPESRAADLEPTAGARWRPCRSPQVADPPG